MNRIRVPRGFDVAICVILIAGAAALYLPHAGIPFFGDDFEFRFADPRRYIFGVFGYSDVRWFRPIKASWCALNQYLFGEDTFVLQAGHVAIHAMLICGLFWFLRACGRSRWVGFIGAAWLLVNPIGVSTILGNDGTDNAGCGAAGFMAFACAWRFTEALLARERPGPGARWLGAGSLVALVLALLFKESGVAYVGIVLAVLGFGLWRCRSHRPQAARALWLCVAACAAITAGYFAYRATARGPQPIPFGTGGYEFRIGSNILVNESELLIAPLLPFSTADAYVAVKRRSTPALAAMGSAALAWLILIGSGLTLARQWPAAMALVVLAAATQVPVVLMNHVSELYAYGAAPFLAIVVALAVPPLLQARWPPIVRGVTAVFLICSLTSSVIAVDRKASQLAVNGHDAQVLVPQVIAFARQVPPGGSLVIYAPREPARLAYSVYLGGPLMALDDGSDCRYVGSWVKHEAGRPDIEVAFVTEPPRDAAAMVLVADATGVGVHAQSVPAAAGRMP